MDIRAHLNFLSFNSRFWAMSLLCSIGFFANPAQAVPSFARQTGYACEKCHIGAFGPQLTPYGIRFKINAYSETDHKGLKLPIAAMVMSSFSHTSADLPAPVTPHSDVNDNFAIDQISGFIAGRITDDFGLFGQVTYSDVGKSASIDNFDIRYAHDFVIAKTDAVLGISVNNNPGVQDAGNTIPAWSFPYISTAFVSGTGDFGTKLNGAFAQSVTGLSAYAFIDDSIYAEIGTYRALSPAMQIKFGLGGDTTGRLNPSTLYWRLNYIKDLNKQAFSVGLVGFNVDQQPERIDGGPIDSFHDLGIDASYMWLPSSNHNFTAYASFVRENLTLRDTPATSPTGRLYDFRFNASYYYKQTYGVTLARFSTRGTQDSTLYAPNLSPDTSGTVFQIDWTPWGKADSWMRPFANARFGLQYTMYDRFDGAASNYDGAGRNASDNNTLFLFLWAAI